MKGFDVKSTYDMDTEDGSLLWTITLKNKSDSYLEFGDVGLPMPWNNKYTTQNSVYSERVTAHTFAGADSGYAYAIRCSGEGNYILFTPVATSGARIEYVDQLDRQQQRRQRQPYRQHVLQLDGRLRRMAAGPERLLHPLQGYPQDRPQLLRRCDQPHPRAG